MFCRRYYKHYIYIYIHPERGRNGEREPFRAQKNKNPSCSCDGGQTPFLPSAPRQRPFAVSGICAENHVPPTVAGPRHATIVLFARTKNKTKYINKYILKLVNRHKFPVTRFFPVNLHIMPLSFCIIYSTRCRYRTSYTPHPMVANYRNNNNKKNDNYTADVIMKPPAKIGNNATLEGSTTEDNLEYIRKLTFSCS